MNELSDTKPKRPMDKMNIGGEVAALDGLLSMINNPAITDTGLKNYSPPNSPSPVNIGPPAEQNLPTGSAEVNQSSAIIPAKPVQVLTHNNPSRASRLFFTGRLGVGKDYCATAAGYTIFGFSEPLYHLAQHFFGGKISATEGKDIPGMRAFLQASGQWGRNVINEQYPLTPARACFITMVRSLAAAGIIKGFEVDWASYGVNPDIWLDSCIARAVDAGDGSRVAITNVRFENEYTRLQSEGWQGWHVVCSTTTWRERLLAKKLTPDSPQAKDTSERLAAAIDADLTKKISKQPTGSKLRVIWNDTVKPPSSRLYTLSEWLATFKTENNPIIGE